MPSPLTAQRASGTDGANSADSDTQVQLLLRQADLASRIRRLAIHEGETRTAIPGVSLWRVDRPSEPVHSVHRPALALIAQGAKRMFLADELYDYDAAHHLFVGNDLPVMGQVLHATPEQPYLCLKLDLDPAELVEQARHVQMPPQRQAVGAGVRGLFVGRNSIELLDPVLRLLRLLETPEHLQALAPLTLREIIYRLLTGEEGWRLAQQLGGAGSATRVSQAIAWLCARYTEPLSIEAMARAVHMSPSSLHHHFKTVTAMSPLQ
ncbi:MAG: AraC family transcriptional regulator, partial [Burkholderiaceae bacterium]